jgi:alkanesulfonate monooxygenase SsuD/methylene tetrahydromethanopterin reductase-like flavin-dependent oxidoreductase (luciferase family)
MKIGIGLPNQVRNVNPAVIIPWATRAEQAGFSSLTTTGRIAYPAVQDTVALAAAAGATSTIELISDILVGPAWSPVLLAKEAAAIDGVSGGRFTLGLGLGARVDDYTVEGRGPGGLGKVLDADLDVFESVWNGEPVGGGTNPGVPQGTRPVPMLFGGSAPATFARMAKWGTGYVGGGLPANFTKPAFDAARQAWTAAGRDGSPRLLAGCYFGLSNPDQGRANVADYYTVTPDFAELMKANILTTADVIRNAVKTYEEIGTDQLVFVPSTADLDDIDRLAEIVL